MNEKAFIEDVLRPLIRSEEAAEFRDDVAVLRPSSHPQIITTDTLIEGRHFRIGDDWASVAVKLVRVNVSDCLAKGALPTRCLLNLSWNAQRSFESLRAFVSGLATELETFQIDLIGGDTTSHDGPVVLSLTLIGECLSSDGPVRRQGARPGDQVWVSGSIGDAFLGLHCANPKTDVQNALNERYLRPVLPNASIADLISSYASSSMDVSDGLVIDAQQIAKASNCGLVIDLDEVPVSDEARAYLSETGLTIRDLVGGGDDYQVLFSASPEQSEAILSFARQNNLRLTCIGRVEVGAGVRCLEGGVDVTESLKAGWQHNLTD